MDNYSSAVIKWTTCYWSSSIINQKGNALFSSNFCDFRDGKWNKLRIRKCFTKIRSCFIITQITKAIWIFGVSKPNFNTHLWQSVYK